MSDAEGYVVNSCEAIESILFEVSLRVKTNPGTEIIGSLSFTEMMCHSQHLLVKWTLIPLFKKF